MKALLLAFALAALQVPALAQQPSAASLERLLEVTQAQRMTDTVLQQVDAAMKPMFDQALGARNLSPEDRRKAEQFMASFSVKMKAIMAEEMSWAKMKDFSLQIYRESFTQKEVDDLIAFYESPSGRAFVEKMPVVMQKSMQVMQQRMGPMMARIQAAARDATKEFQAQNPPAPAPAR